MKEIPALNILRNFSKDQLFGHILRHQCCSHQELNTPYTNGGQASVFLRQAMLEAHDITRAGEHLVGEQLMLLLYTLLKNLWLNKSFIYLFDVIDLIFVSCVIHRALQLNRFMTKKRGIPALRVKHKASGQLVPVMKVIVDMQDALLAHSEQCVTNHKLDPDWRFAGSLGQFKAFKSRGLDSFNSSSSRPTIRDPAALYAP
ncbi:hypothetical protein PsorP6_001432 [Peronosclerospora sorghi]|uniref:Uncharacterized protein n=1 Tax=Peronosclerospora sorghi TaxID=230839 RepID=A0ACC0WV09_9STRA|nr:hypothetical protein PsorP6_001432 [Peronosclerospora sorghi]